METNLQDRKQMSCCLGDEPVGKGQNEELERGTRKIWMEMDICYIDCVDYFAGICKWQNLANYIVQIHVVCQLYHNIAEKGLPWCLRWQESACNAGDLSLIPRLGRYPGGGHGNPLQYSCLENPTDRGAWRATVYGVAKNWT